MGLILLIVVLVILFGGGGGYYAHRSYGGRGLGGVLGLIIVILVLVWLLGGLHGLGPGPVLSSSTHSRETGAWGPPRH